jgi:hypothetical protein
MSEDEDAQRILERKALANARGLVEKLEAQERDKYVDPVRLALLSLAVLAIVAAVAFAWLQYRRAALAAPAMKPTSAMTVPDYVRQSLAHIEWVANNTKGFKREMALLDGRVGFTMAIDARGYIRSLDVTTPSSNATLDRQATRIIKFSEPFGALPDAVRKASDELRVTGTARIGPSKSGDVAFSIEGEGAR